MGIKQAVYNVLCILIVIAVIVGMCLYFGIDLNTIIYKF